MTFLEPKLKGRNFIRQVAQYTHIANFPQNFPSLTLSYSVQSGLFIIPLVWNMYTMIWSLCALCQEPTGESLKCPATSKDVAGIAKVYTDTASLLKRFQEADKLPTKFHPRLTEFLLTSDDAGKTFNAESAKWHSSCKSHITETKLKKLTTCKRKSAETAVPAPVEKKTTRSQTVKFDQNTCFVPGCWILA